MTCLIDNLEFAKTLHATLLRRGLRGWAHEEAHIFLKGKRFSVIILSFTKQDSDAMCVVQSTLEHH